MRLLDRASPSFLYQQVIDFIEHQQKIGALSPGDKLPSLRKLSAQFEISVPTIKQAYIELERQGRVCARPQSGYYLTAQQARTLKPRPALWSHCEPTTVQCRSMIEQVHEAVHFQNLFYLLVISSQLLSIVIQSMHYLLFEKAAQWLGAALFCKCRRML